MLSFEVLVNISEHLSYMKYWNILVLIVNTSTEDEEILKSGKRNFSTIHREKGMTLLTMRCWGFWTS